MFFQKTRKLCRKSEHFFSKAKKMVTVSFTDERMNETLTFPRLWCAMAFALVMFCGAFADAQVPAEVSSLSLGGTFSQAGEDLNLGFIGGDTHRSDMNGHVAWFLQRGSSAEIVLSETLNAHIQGGLTGTRLGIERFWRCTAGY